MTQGFLRTIIKLMGIVFVIIPFSIASIGLLAFLAITIFTYTGFIGLAIAIVLFIWCVIKNRKRR